MRLFPSQRMARSCFDLAISAAEAPSSERPVPDFSYEALLQRLDEARAGGSCALGADRSPKSLFPVAYGPLMCRDEDSNIRYNEGNEECNDDFNPNGQ